MARKGLHARAHGEDQEEVPMGILKPPGASRVKDQAVVTLMGLLVWNHQKMMTQKMRETLNLLKKSAMPPGQVLVRWQPLLVEVDPIPLALVSWLETLEGIRKLGRDTCPGIRVLTIISSDSRKPFLD
jgi:hypothetical protein